MQDFYQLIHEDYLKRSLGGLYVSVLIAVCALMWVVRGLRPMFCSLSGLHSVGRHVLSVNIIYIYIYIYTSLIPLYSPKTY